MKQQEEQILTIKAIYPNVSNIYKPLTKGFAHEVYIVESDNGKFICRFSHKEISEHNMYISKLLQSHNINVPDVSLYNINGQYCETYPFIEGKTFHERLIEGMPVENQTKVFQELLNISYKIAEIPYDNNVKKQFPEVLFARITKKFFRIINKHRTVLSHTDLTARNVILDNSDNVKAIIDLDSVLPESNIFTLLVLAREADAYGYDVNKLLKLYKNIQHVEYDIDPQIQIKTFMVLRKIYKTIFNEFMRKQLLKIRIN